jgi:dienelactone hydrolase
LACVAVLLLTTPAALAAPPEKQSGVIYLKDGFVLKGYVVQPSETIIDPFSQQPITLHQGIFLVDDGCRRYMFSHGHVERAEYRPFDLGRAVSFPRYNSFLDGKSVLPVRELLDVGSWNETQDRTYKFRAPDREVTLTQHLVYLTPHYARVDSLGRDPVTLKENPYAWTSYYRTREFGPDLAVRLLSMHKDMKDSNGLTEDQRADRRFQIFNFLVQGGWMEASEKELERIKRDFPGQKEKVETAAAGIKKLVLLDRWDEIKLAHAAGRHTAAQKMLEGFATDGEDQPQAEVRALKTRYETANASLKRAKALLAALPKDVATGDEPVLLTEAAAAIAAELNLDHFFKKGENEEGRLERFLTQADQAERFAKANAPHLRPGQLLSVAVTAWVMGPASAETKPESARRAWEGRRFAREYQRTADAGARAALLKDYESKGGLSPAEMAQLIGHLPPPDPPEKTSSVETEIKVGTGKGTTYRLKLPPEYHAGRSYPVLIALHHYGEAGKDMVKRLGDETARHGYILACPDWDQGTGGAYAYSAEEHATVLDTVRDLRQHFNIDSDRVFLTGYGEGGNMAWDVGLSHPDLFAGVIPIAGQPRNQAVAYWPNAMQLPFYTVWGERMGGPGGMEDQKKTNANVVIFNMFKEHWIPRGAPALGVQCKGRGLEWFAGELPDIFQWMAPKRRNNPQKVGYKDVVNKDGEVTEYQDSMRSMRETDNRFYWVTLDGILVRKGSATTVSAKIVNGNQIGVWADGVKRVTLWMGRGMIDFDKPITVRRNGNIRLNAVPVKPSLAVLLEDFFDRGDRQRLYLAKIELK